ncbi:branched-chain amino acid ABC transporter permease [Noviherbaspirillum sedimenti]|uniref:Branched-chain amino acid ABC transporter permease n=1 Tax=Noviherbaspirillum sedimenti TaxID=2320865 RepID=A0A3A3G470_9BURK|nr:branched-chain amino acid ABC transporter permease [Noviherbaspirillum sedimenti]RJG03287.1 branched-chain amino acid ABC transporter permease [Noviherbaspirillum sedimenti]
MPVLEQIFVNGLLSALVYMLMALGFTLVFGMMRIVNFAHGEFYMVGAFAVLVFYGFLGLPYAVAIAAAVVVAIVLGYLLERFVLRSVASDEMSSMITTLGIAITLQSLVLILFGPSEQAVNRPISGTLSLDNAIVSLDHLAVGIAALVVLTLFCVLMKKTKWGLAMRAVAQDRETASLMGIPTSAVQSMGFVCATILAALAGGLMAPI